MKYRRPRTYIFILILRIVGFWLNNRPYIYRWHSQESWIKIITFIRYCNTLTSRNQFLCVLFQYLFLLILIFSSQHCFHSPWLVLFVIAYGNVWSVQRLLSNNFSHFQRLLKFIKEMKIEFKEENKLEKNLTSKDFYKFRNWEKKIIKHSSVQYFNKK